MKLLKILFLILPILATTGCGARHFRDTALYHPSGRSKPVVAVLPVINSVESASVSWDLSREMTEEIRKRVADSSRIYLLNSQASLATSLALNHPDIHKISPDTSTNLAPAEFVVVTELIDQSADKKGAKDSSETIKMAMRLRVIDLRGKEPRVVLQEVVRHNQEVAKGYLHCDYAKTPWGSSAFVNTPLGMAHSKIVREIVAHIEGYIGL
jgi:hypothetical protein